MPSTDCKTPSESTSTWRTAAVGGLFFIAIAAFGWRIAAAEPASLSTASPSPAPAETTAELPSPRRPVAGVWESSNRLWVAHRSGSIQAVDPHTGRVELEASFPGIRRLVDASWSFYLAPAAARAPGGKGEAEAAVRAEVPPPQALLLDAAERSLLRIELAARPPKVLQVLPLPMDPVAVRWNPNRTVAAVAGMWARQILFVQTSPEGMTLGAQVELPFPPGEVLWRDDGTALAAADRFGGRIAVLETPAGAPPALAAVHAVEVHNLRGMAWSQSGPEPGKRLLVCGQILNEQSPSGLNEIAAGTLIQNALFRLDWRALAKPAELRPEDYERTMLGRTASGAADPSALWTDPDGRLWVATAGSSEVHILDTEEGVERDRLDTGVRPLRLVPSPDGQWMASLNQLDDSWTLFDAAEMRRVRSFSFGETRPLRSQERGEVLFYDGRLSHESWLSCHSCHGEGHTPGLLSDTFGDGTHGTPKRIPSLLGTAPNTPWGWLGNQRELHDQVESSVATSMHGPALDRRQSSDLAMFLTSLDPAPPRRPAAASPGDAALLAEGKRIFVARDCGRCHVPPLTYAGFDNVEVPGLQDEAGAKKFNPPSLRGIGQQERFLHDGRANSLEEVFTKHAHPDGEDSSKEEAAALRRFLESL